MKMLPRETEGQIGRAAVTMFAANNHMHQMLIENLRPEAWRARPAAKARTIAAIFTHVHNVRCKWVRLTAPHLKTPALLNRARCTPKEAAAGLAESAMRCGEMLTEAFDGGGRVLTFRRDGWAPAWPAGPEMVFYMLAHEAHHRGQVCMLAGLVGCPLPKDVVHGMWNWEKLWKDGESRHGER